MILVAVYDMPDLPAAKRLINPWPLTWSEVDPARHAFDASSAPDVVRSLPPALDVPARPPGSPLEPEVARWIHDVGDAWADTMSTALVGHYGRWASGWRWAVGEGDFDGGPISSWCCSAHSMPSPEAALDAVIAALLEWRSWLEELGERFQRFPTDTDTDTWERAVAHLVTVVVERTEARSGWYGHCRVVLRWFLDASGVPPEQHAALLDDAIGGRFRSWSEPEGPVVADVAERLARTVPRRTGA